MTYVRSRSGLQFQLDWLNPSRTAQMADILRIERLTNPKPWSDDEFRHLLLHGHLARVALLGGFAAGFLVYEACEAGRRIVSIAVDPEVQRLGIGTMLVGCLKRQMADVPRLTEIVAHVPESQLPVQQFLRSNQFRWTKTIERHSGGSLYVMTHAKQTVSRDAMVGIRPVIQESDSDHLKSYS